MILVTSVWLGLAVVMILNLVFLTQYCSMPVYVPHSFCWCWGLFFL